MSVRSIGDATVARIEEMFVRETPGVLFAGCEPHHLAPHLGWLQPSCMDPATGEFLLSVHSWLVRTRHHTILVDSCAGNHKQRRTSPRFHDLDTPWLDRLKAAGVAPEAIDFVLCTHLHLDHVGWNTELRDGRWVPTFPNARYVFSRAEHDHYGRAADELPAQQQQIFQDSVAPVIAAGQDLIIDGAHALDDEIRLLPTPGHTPGHLAVNLRSGDREALFIGDIMHHPMQVYHPEWNSRFCSDQDLARKTRRQVLEHAAETRSLVLPAHFGAPHAGLVDRKGDEFSFRFEE
jgi:glyoxylase-like metal-dependent hydrolase (beta-lactamase superfamily II)